MCTLSRLRQIQGRNNKILQTAVKIKLKNTESNNLYENCFKCLTEKGTRVFLIL